uniref:Uncharacterized protein n=1 Tax=Arundo donax TaxID=35708 RepID=A0A0A9AX83_ARUDO
MKTERKISGPTDAVFHIFPIISVLIGNYRKSDENRN